MTLKDRLNEDMKAAMKEREAGKVRLSVIRMVRAAVKNAEIAKNQDLSDEQVIEVIQREIKLRRNALADYERAGRQEAIETLNQEIAILMSYLPQQLSEDELKELVREAVEQAQAKDPRDMGKVMAIIMPKVKGRADGKLVNQMVKEKLGS